MTLLSLRSVAALFVIAQAVPSSAPIPGARTGLIIGQVIGAATGAPMAGATVQISMPKFFDNPAAPKGRVIADDEGRFFFADLPPGDYYLSAGKAGYMPGAYGQRRPMGETQQLTLAEGERRTDVKLAIWKYGVIAGTVVDEAGEPVVGVTVNALSRDFLAGRARYGKMSTEPFNLPVAVTDDRGAFRFPRLAPGGYVVVVRSTQTTVPISVLGSFAQNSSLRGDLLQAVTPNGSSNVNAVYDSFPLGQSRTEQIGDAALITLNGVQLPPPAGASGRIDVYRTTYFPSATTAASAAVITLTGDRERTDVNVRLQPSPAYRVSGRLVTPAGVPPPPMAIRLIGESATDVGDDGFEAAIGMSDSSGKFTLLGVPPGEYVIKNVNNTFAPAHRQGLPALWVQQKLAVGAKNIDDLIVGLRDELRFEGRVEFRSAGGKQPGTRDIGTSGVVFEPPAGADMLFSPRAQYVNRATFSTFGPAGTYFVRPREGVGWAVESVTLDGKDITDRPVDFSEDTTSLVIVYSDKLATVTGTIKDARGETVTTGVAVAFPVDSTHWSGYGANPRTVKRATGSRGNAYTFDNLPAGEYFIIAIDGAVADNWTDPQMLERLAPQATKVTINAGEPKTLDLTLKVIR